LDEYLKSRGFDVPNGNFLNTIFLDVFGTQFMKDRHLPEPAYLNSDAYFKLLDYEELKQARKSSKEAKTMAFWAICISGFLALFSIGLSFYQIKTQTNEIYISQEQFEELKQLSIKSEI